MPVNKDIFKMHVDQAQLNGMAFWLGFANGFLNEVMPKKVKLASRDNDRMYAAIEQVYDSIYGKSRDYTPQVALQLREQLALNGVGATEDGLKYLWDGFVTAHEPEQGKTAEAFNRFSRLLDMDLRYAVEKRRDEIVSEIEATGIARVDGMSATVIFHGSAKRPGFWQATIFGGGNVPIGDYTARTPAEVVDAVVSSKGQIHHSKAAVKEV